MSAFAHSSLQCVLREERSPGRPRNAPHGSLDAAFTQMGTAMVPMDATRASRFSPASGANANLLVPSLQRQHSTHSSSSQNEGSNLMDDGSREHAPEHQSLATTKVRGSPSAITQAEFVSIICRPGAGACSLSELFDFRRPKAGQRSKTSKILLLDEKQLDAMYALSGCSDVQSVMSSVNKHARDAMWDVYGIDKHGFSTWFKNRRLVPKERPATTSSALKKQKSALSSPLHDLKRQSSAKASPNQSFIHLGSDPMLVGLIRSCPSLPATLPGRQQLSINLGGAPDFIAPPHISLPPNPTFLGAGSSALFSANPANLLDEAIANATKDAAKQQSLLNKEISLVRDFQDDRCDKLDDLPFEGQSGQGGLLNGSSPTQNDPMVSDMDEFDLLLSSNCNRAWLD